MCAHVLASGVNEDEPKPFIVVEPLLREELQVCALTVPSARRPAARSIVWRLFACAHGVDWLTRTFDLHLI